MPTNPEKAALVELSYCEVAEVEQLGSRKDDVEKAVSIYN
jgi:hypothetical protein